MSTDASRFWMRAEGWCWFFGAVDHCASDIVGWHVAKKGPLGGAGADPPGRPGPVQEVQPIRLTLAGAARFLLVSGCTAERRFGPSREEDPLRL